MPMNFSSTAPDSIGRPEIESVVSIAMLQTEPTAVTLQDVAPLLASSRRAHLLEWNLAENNGDSLHWHGGFGHKNALHTAPLTDDKKMTYLKALVTGKAKTAFAEFAYCKSLHKNGLKTVEWKLRQPSAVVRACSDKFDNFPPFEMQSSENLISSSGTTSALMGNFCSLHYHQDLSSASLLGQGTQKLLPKLKKVCNEELGSLLEFNERLNDKAEAHEKMKLTLGKL